MARLDFRWDYYYYFHTVVLLCLVLEKRPLLSMEDQLIDGSRGKLQKRSRTRTIKVAMPVILEQFILDLVSKK